MTTTIEAIPLGVYVHVPWCVRKCPYCDFNSHALEGRAPGEDWLARIEADLDSEADVLAGRPLRTVFFGGGTPSLLEPEIIGGVLTALQRRARFADDIEITLEANPGAADAARFAGYRAAGVNRLSIGVQSFDDAMLARLGRVHDAAAARNAIEDARRAGFSRVNVDLMHGLPGQRVAGAVADIDAALALGVDHLSWYQLTIERNTAFHSAPPILPDEDDCAAIEEAGAARIRAAGLSRYEVSAWCRPGEEARHNLGYWTFGDYVGVGPGAHGKISRHAADGLHVERTQRTRAPSHWLEPSAAEARNARRVDAADLPGEFAMGALRLVDGVAWETFAARTGLGEAALRATAAPLVEQGLLRSDRFATTETGLRFLDRVVAAFLA